MRTAPALFLLAGCSLRPGDVAYVAVSGSQVTVTAASADVAALHLQDCDGGTETILVNETLDLLSASPRPFTMPGGVWCGFGLELARDGEAGALHLDGTTGATSFLVDLDPGLVPVTQEWVVDGDEWVLVLDGDKLLDRALIEAHGTEAVIGPADPDGATLVGGVRESLWLGTVPEARDVIYVDLWPFPDVSFDLGVGDIDVTISGCNGGGTIASDLDADGIIDVEDPDRDGDGTDDVDDPDDDGDGVEDTTDPTPGGEVGDDGLDEGAGTGCNGDGPEGSGSTGGSSGGCDASEDPDPDPDPDPGPGDPGGGDGGDGCGGGGGGSSSGGCDDGGSGCDGSGGSSGCDVDTCSTVGFVPPWAVLIASIVLLRRRRAG